MQAKKYGIRTLINPRMQVNSPHSLFEPTPAQHHEGSQALEPDQAPQTTVKASPNIILRECQIEGGEVGIHLSGERRGHGLMATGYLVVILMVIILMVIIIVIVLVCQARGTGLALWLS